MTMLPAGPRLGRSREPDVTASDIRYEEPAEVTRVILHMEYSDGRVREWDSPEPQDFCLSETMVTRKTGLGIGHAGGFAGVSQAVPSVRVSFTAHPKRNMFIWTSAKLLLSDEMRSALGKLAEAMGGRLSWLPGSGPGRA